jgi:hypothetical protein
MSQFSAVSGKLEQAKFMRIYPLPFKEAFEQHHFIVNTFYKGVTIITKHCLELMLLKHSETGILNGNGYIVISK